MTGVSTAFTVVVVLAETVGLFPPRKLEKKDCLAGGGPGSWFRAASPLVIVGRLTTGTGFTGTSNFGSICEGSRDVVTAGAFPNKNLLGGGVDFGVLDSLLNSDTVGAAGTVTAGRI
jgi:hypothetical protein